VQRRIVKTGQKQGQLRVIESGLAPGDWVVTEGVQRAFPGAKVEPQQTKLTPAETDQSGLGQSSPGQSSPGQSGPDRSGPGAASAPDPAAK
jgi:hypothetical protein